MYLNSENFYLSFAKELEISRTIIHSWFLKYEKHGNCDFDIASTNVSYTKAFKENVVLKVPIDNSL